jgi:hypothetical protein
MGPRSVVSITSKRLSPSMPTKYFTSSESGNQALDTSASCGAMAVLTDGS